MSFLLYMRISAFLNHLDRHTIKTMRWPMRTLKTPVSLGIFPQLNQSSLSASRNLGSLITHWVHSKDSDQTGWMPSWSESSLDAQLILLVWSLYGFYSVLMHIKYRFFGFQWHVQLFKINLGEVMIVKKQGQWRGKHNAKKIKCYDQHYSWVQHYWFSRAARSVALKWTQVSCIL